MRFILKILKYKIKLLIFFVAVWGAFVANFHYRKYSTMSHATDMEINFNYNDTLHFNESGGNPIFWTNAANNRTVIFLGELTSPNPIGPFFNFLSHLHRYESANVIAPITGIQSTPVFLRARNWNPLEDARQAFQLYETLTSVLPASHKIILVSHGTGSFGALAILAEATRKPQEVIMMSPANAEISYRDKSIKIRIMATMPEPLQYLLPLAVSGEYEDKKEYYDNFPEFRASHVYSIYNTALDFEKKVIPKIANRRISVVWGDNDPTYNQSGYERIVKLLMDSGNEVRPHKLRNTAYNVFVGEEISKAENIIIQAIRN